MLSTCVLWVRIPRAAQTEERASERSRLQPGKVLGALPSSVSVVMADMDNQLSCMPVTHENSGQHRVSAHVVLTLKKESRNVTECSSYPS